MTRVFFAIFGLLIGGAVFFFYTQPTYDQIRALGAQNAQYDEALTKSTQLQQLKQSLLSRYNALNQSELDRLQRLLPDHVDNVRLVLDIDNLAGRFGLGLENVIVQTPQVSGATQTIAGSLGASSQLYDSLTLSFTTHGTYSSFTQFLAALESSLRIVDVEELQMIQSGVANGEPLYRFDITIRTYWLK